jgi:hypothetical protein
MLQAKLRLKSLGRRTWPDRQNGATSIQNGFRCSTRKSDDRQRRFLWTLGRSPETKKIQVKLAGIEARIAKTEDKLPA